MADDHDHDHEESDSRDFSKSEGWVYGLIFTLIIGLVGLTCSIVVVFIKKRSNFDFK